MSSSSLVRSTGESCKGHDDGTGPLPDCIYDIIVSFLPVRDAIRCSFVSRAWRFRWRSIPYLILDEKDFGDDVRKVGERNLSFLIGVMFNFKLPIKRFELSAPIDNYQIMDFWIFTLFMKDIEHFVFKSYEYNYLVPSFLFRFRSLTLLNLSSCDLVIPPEVEFTGFPNLTDLVLEEVYFREPSQTTTLGHFIASCPMLKRLSLLNVNDVEDAHGFETSSASLEWLYLKSFDSLGFIRIHAPKLSFAKIAVIYSLDIYDEDLPNTFNLINVLPSINNVEKLVIEESLGVFTMSKVPPEIPFEFPYLKHLELVASFECLDEIICATCLVSSAPMLRRLCVESSPYLGPMKKVFEKDLRNWDNILQSCKLDDLQLFEFTRMLWISEELSFLELVLEKATSLSKLVISLESEVDCVENLAKYLSTMKRESTHGTLRIKDIDLSF